MSNKERKDILDLFLDWLKKYRKQERLSVRALSARTGISLPTLYRLVHRTKETRLSTIQRLCDALDVKLEHILAAGAEERKDS